MSADAIAWAIGLGLPILTAAVLFLANWDGLYQKAMQVIA